MKKATSSVLALFLCTALSATASAQSTQMVPSKPATKSGPVKNTTPLEFRGVAIGDDIKTMWEPFRMSCMAVTLDEMDQLCKLHTDYPINLQDLYAAFIKEKLVRITAKFDPDSYGELLDVMTVKYGKPDRVVTRTVENGFGAKRNSRTAYWVRGDVTFTIAEPEAKQTNGFLMMMRPEEIAQILEKRTQKKASKL